MFFLGMKFKLVKSNSCSSRLELAGTGLPNPKIFDQDVIKAIEMKMNPPRTPPPTTDEEETVRDMIYRLEGKKEVVLSKPRIIESKCIEKIYPENNRVDDTVTINSQMIEIPKEEEILKEEIVEHQSNFETNLLSDSVTVNNHISYTAAPMLKKEDANHYPEEKSKVVRNRNVDLAFSASLQQGNNKPIKDKENLARKVSSSMSKLSSKENVNENETRSDSKLTKWDSVGKLESIEMVKKQEKKNVPLGNSKSSIELPSALKSSNSTGNKTTKMVNWSTVGKVDKEYFANDRTLVTGKKYDEMEFEEFEVLGEQHYDSLNSK